MKMTLVPVHQSVLECSRIVEAWMQSSRPGFAHTRNATEWLSNIRVKVDNNPGYGRKYASLVLKYSKEKASSAKQDVCDL